MEEPDERFDDILAVEPARRNMMLTIIRRVAVDLDRSILGKCRMVRLDRIESKDGRKWPIIVKNKDGAVSLKMRTVPICSFNGLGYPVPVKNEE